MNEDGRPSERLRGAASTGRTVGDVADMLGDDAPFLLLLLLAAFALVPGAAPLFAACMIVVASSLLLGRDRLALPDAVRRRPVGARTLDHAIDRLARFERLVGARKGGFGGGSRTAAVLVIWNAVLVILPIPLANGPPAVAALLIALGIVERNRRALLIGLVATAIATTFEIVLLWIGIDFVEWLWRAF